MLAQAEYIWLDGSHPTQGLRSKMRVVDLPDATIDPAAFPRWSFDGSSTSQSDGADSDLLLQPVRVVRDPIRTNGYLVLCEVLDAKGEAHRTNTRARLRATLDRGGNRHAPWIGFEQEYTLLAGDRVLGFPVSGFPAPQGPYYCGVGSDRAFGRDLVEEHTSACLDAGLLIYGVNAEVMPGQWEFQIGYRGRETERADLLTVCDHAWIARWLLFRLGEKHGTTPTFDVKPVKGDWNGAGCHTNFSTAAMRDEESGLDAIYEAIERLAVRHAEHVAEYGADLAERLTGLHETCAIDEFREGVADRGASIRIPRHVEERGHGYFEDRRPGANCDPYRVAAMLVETVCQRSSKSQMALAG